MGGHPISIQLSNDLLWNKEVQEFKEELWGQLHGSCWTISAYSKRCLRTQLLLSFLVKPQYGC
eukprot:1156693-Pelagomonas_calceolata.AAC.7